MSNNTNIENETNIKRREILKGLATVPVLGLFLVNLWRKIRRDALKKANLLSDLVQEKSAPTIISGLSDSRHLNIGIIGYGGRGSHLIRGAGFATKQWTDIVAENARNNKLDKQFETFMTQYADTANAELLGEARAKLREARDRLSDSSFIVGRFYYRNKYYSGAIDRFRAILDDDPGYTRRDVVYYHLADSLASTDRAVEALSVCAEKLQRRDVWVTRNVATEACRRAADGA